MNRNYGIDVLRALAVLMVLTHHMRPISGEAWASWGTMFHWIGRGGWTGVDLFFVLSGHLVSRQLIEEHRRCGKVQIGRFLVRRGFKIYPSFLVLIATTVVVFALRGRSLSGVLHELTFTQNYFGGLWVHTWSLAVEEHFYFLLGGIVFVARRGDFSTYLRWLFWCSWSAIALVFGMRILNQQSTEFMERLEIFPTHLRLDGLFFGVIVAVVQAWSPESFAKACRRFALPLLIVGASCFLPAFLWDVRSTPWIRRLGLPLFSVGGVCLLCGVQHFRSIFGFGWLGRVGRDSYSIYLWHLPFAVWVLASAEKLTGPLRGPGYAFFYFSGCVVVGCVMAAVVETPFLRFRDRVCPSANPTVTPLPLSF